jgi:hypothetical protein
MTFLVLGRAEGWLEVMYDRDKVPYSQFLAMLRQVTFFLLISVKPTRGMREKVVGKVPVLYNTDSLLINSLPNVLTDTTLIRTVPISKLY